MTAEQKDDFGAFLEAVRGERVLHLGHRDADCDALGSAYAMSQLLPGDVGFAEGCKASARDLAQWLGLSPLLDPDPAAYSFTILYDVNSVAMAGVRLAPRYALFDHHVPGGHRYSSFHNELVDGAEWCWVRSVESTCSLLVELFEECSLPVGREMAVALAAGILTDTWWLDLADSAALRRLACVLEWGGLYVEDVMSVIDSQARRAARRTAVLVALRHARETLAGRWSVLSAQTDSLGHAFGVTASLRRLGGDVALVAFPKDGEEMVMLECWASVVESTDLDLSAVAAQVAEILGAGHTWGTRMFGRITAPMPQQELLGRCVSAVVSILL
jgi:nanoRNase/pAp phosphatase (c-di-AMP/oligoRNAs hydrolase)